MRKILNNTKVKATGAINRAKNVLNNDRGDFYISDGVKSLSLLYWEHSCLVPLQASLTTPLFPVSLRKLLSCSARNRAGWKEVMNQWIQCSA